MVTVGSVRASGSIAHIHMTAPHFKTIQIQIIFKRYSVKNHMGGKSVGWPFPKIYPCPKVVGSNPANNINFNPMLG